MYLGLKICFVKGDRIFSVKCTLIKFTFQNLSAIYFCTSKTLKLAFKSGVLLGLVIRNEYFEVKKISIKWWLVRFQINKTYTGCLPYMPYFFLC